jgi:hypothetical protein
MIAHTRLSTTVRDDDVLDDRTVHRGQRALLEVLRGAPRRPGSRPGSRTHRRHLNSTQRQEAAKDSVSPCSGGIVRAGGSPNAELDRRGALLVFAAPRFRTGTRRRSRRSSTRS